MRRVASKRWHDYRTFFWLFLASAFFSNGPNNPFGVEYASEMVTAAAFLDLLHSIVRRRPLPPLSGLIFYIPIIAAFYSSSMAYFSYGQPLIYGFIEERRMFEIWVYFPLARHIACSSDIRVIIKQVIFLGLIITVIGFSNRLGLFDGWKQIDVGAGALRQLRANFSGHFVIISAITALVMGSALRARTLAVINLIFVATFLLFVSQTRQYFLVLVIAIAVFSVFGTWRPTIRLAVASAGMFLLAFAAILFLGLGAPMESNTVRLFLQLFDGNFLSSNSRALALGAVFRDISFFGHGALSLQWENGFARVYGNYFFLADIGIFGTVHRFGIVTIVYMFVTLRLLRGAISGAAQISPIYSNLPALYSIVLVLLWPLGGILEYRGMSVALILALSLGWLRSAPTQRQAEDLDRDKSFQACAT